MGQSVETPFKEELENAVILTVDENNNITYLRDKDSNEQIMLRKWIYTEEGSQKSAYDLHKQRLQYRSHYLLKLKKMQSTIRQTPCNNYYQIDTLWEHEENTLEHLMKQKQQKNQKFSENQIWCVASNCIEALAQMQTNNSIHEKITKSTIVVVASNDKTYNTFKVRDPLSIPTEDNFSLVFRNLNTQGIYLSPDQCHALEQFSYCKKCNKDDVWALGFILMEVALMESQASCYFQDSRKINAARISENISRIGKIYSKKLKNLIASMLEFNKKSRPSWNQLIQGLKKNTEIEKQIKLTEVTNYNTHPDSNGSPQVFPYKSVHIEQAETYSFSKNHFNGNTGKQIIQEVQKENILNNQIYIPPPQYKYLYQQRQKTLVNFAKLEPQPILYVPIERTVNKQNNQNLMIGQQLHQTNQNFKPVVSFNAPQYQNMQIKKFTSPASNEGLLFKTEQKNKQINNVLCIESCYQKQKISQTRHQPQISNDLKQKPRVFNNDIKNAESITYEGDFRPVFSQVAKQKQRNQQFNNNKQTELQPLNSVVPSNDGEGDHDDQDKIEYVVEVFDVGSRYEGYKLRNMRHGQGRFYYQDGGMYDGQWEYNKMNGKGMLYYQSGVLAYDGQWKNDQFEGRGKLYNQSPEKIQGAYDYQNFDNIGECWQYYDGEFCNDLKQGRGKLMLTNGQYYVGSFTQDMIQGNGKFFTKKGTIKGQWEGNHLVRLD